MTNGGEKREILSVEAFVMDRMADYASRNDLSYDEHFDGLEDTGSHFRVARAERADDPSGLALTYKNESCPISLPAGRQIAFGYDAGLITRMTLTLPLAPMTWDELLGQTERLAVNFEESGWTEIDQIESLTPEQFLDKSGPKWARIGRWSQCDDAGIQATVTAQHYNSTSPGTFMPPAGIGEVLPEDAPDRFLIEVYFHAPDSGIDDDLWKLREARRIDVNGDKNEALSLKVWIDDPDWRPAGWQGAHIR